MPQAASPALNDDRRAELWAVLALSELKRLGASGRGRLAGHYGSLYTAVQNSEEWAGLGLPQEAASCYQRGIWRDEARRKWDLIREAGENILLYSDEAYPELLREIPDPPLLLFYRGDLSLLRNASVGVVGARKCTREGMSVAVDIARDLSRAGVTVISGLALGIDRVVHLAGLEGPGSSIAVLGCGINVTYPKSNLDLYDLMRDKGLILSEFMPGSEPKQYNFPVRNRIISGLSRAVLVVEAAVRSGTLITARHAAEQGRDVFAVPGSTVAETSEGCRDLIRRGAKPVFSAEDILVELAPILKAELEEKMQKRGGKQGAGAAKALDERGMLPWEGEKTARREEEAPPPPKPQMRTSDEMLTITSGCGKIEADILNLLNERPNCHIDSICNALTLEASAVSRALTMLEVKGLVSRLPGMYYVLRQ